MFEDPPAEHAESYAVTPAPATGLIPRSQQNNICTQQASTYKCLPDVRSSATTLTIERKGTPKTPQSSLGPSVPNDQGMASGDVPMVPEDPYFDEEEDEINKLEQALEDKPETRAAKRRKIVATRGI
eukprot:6244829-Amphidinium_carterae.1